MSAGIGHRTRDRDKHRTQSFMRREAARTSEREHVSTSVGHGTPQRFAVTVSRDDGYIARPGYGICAACQIVGLVPTWGDGRCFHCLTEGRLPNGLHEPVIEALGEDSIAPDPTRFWTPELDDAQRDIRELFEEAQGQGRTYSFLAPEERSRFSFGAFHFSGASGRSPENAREGGLARAAVLTGGQRSAISRLGGLANAMSHERRVEIGRASAIIQRAKCTTQQYAEWGRLRGLARARNLSAEALSEIGRKGAEARWGPTRALKVSALQKTTVQP